MAQAVTAERKWWSGGRSPFNVEYGKLMMWYFLMSDAFTFGAFLIAYGTVRFSSHSWPDPNKVFESFPILGTGLPLVFVSLMTFILIMSSVTMVLAVHAGHNNDRKAVMKWMAWTIVGGLAFLSCQAWEWTHLHEEGAWWGRNPFRELRRHRSQHEFYQFLFYHYRISRLPRIQRRDHQYYHADHDMEGCIRKERTLFNDRKSRIVLALCRPGLGICVYLFLFVLN